MATSSQQQALNDIDCLQMWKEELRRVQNALIKAEAEADRACSCYTTILNIKAKLNIYRDNINITNAIIVKIEAELGILLAQLQDDVCNKAQCTVEAMKVLYCFILDFFDCLDKLIVDNVTSLINEIECFNLNKPSIVLKCLQALLEKLTIVAAMQQAVIKQIIEVVECAIEVDKLLCLPEEGNEGDISTGGNCSLENFVSVLNTYYSKNSEGKVLNIGSGAVKINDDDEQIQIGLFMDEICTDISNEFPINNPNGFYGKLDTAVNVIEGVCVQVKEHCDDKRKDADELRACKENLENAIAAATEAKACK